MLQPLRRYALGAAMPSPIFALFPILMGLGLYFETGEGLRFSSTIASRTDIGKLPLFYPKVKLGYVMNAVRTIRHKLKGEVPLIGFSGSPWMLGTYMGKGGSSKAFTKLKKMMYTELATLHLLLDKLSDSMILYLNAQIKAGVQLVMVFDTRCGILTGRTYRKFSLHYRHKIVDGQWLEAMASTGCDALGLDWDTDIVDACPPHGR
jgi:uroporphyrinogen decarboxylase